MPDDKAKHLVELDEKILAVFNVDPTEKMQELFNAKDADIDRTMVESVNRHWILNWKPRHRSTRQSYMRYFRV
jgi:hypothetical protein